MIYSGFSFGFVWNMFQGKRGVAQIVDLGETLIHLLARPLKRCLERCALGCGSRRCLSRKRPLTWRRRPHRPVRWRGSVWGWYYEAPGGEGGSVFVMWAWMWDGDAHFDGVSDEWLRREARRAVDVGERCSMCEKTHVRGK